MTFVIHVMHVKTKLLLLLELGILKARISFSIWFQIVLKPNLKGLDLNQNKTVLLPTVK